MKKLLWIILLPLAVMGQSNIRLVIPPSIPVERGVAGADADLEAVRQSVIKDLLATSVDTAMIRKLCNTQKLDGSWPYINYIDVSRTGFDQSRHLINMMQLAVAFKKPDSPFYKDPKVRNAVLSAYNHWINHDYICENWWWNEMGTPGNLVNIMLVLDTDLSGEQISKGAHITARANFKATGARPGGDLIQIAGMRGKQALLLRSSAVLDSVVITMTGEIHTSTGRGMKPDLSFHHRTDNVISTLAYGTGYAAAFAYWAEKIAGTKYRFPEKATRLMIDYYIDGICQSMAFAKYPDPGAENRGISRLSVLDAVDAQIPQELLKASDYRKAELMQIIDSRNNCADYQVSKDKYFWYSEYYTHQRPAYFTSVRMHSDRQNNMEFPHNEEGLKNHHFADGSIFLTRKGNEYTHIFPVWNWQKIPGTTIVQRKEILHWSQIAKKGLSNFTGGVTDGKYGAAAFDFKSVHDPLTAKKAVFFFDDEYVCLGTDIKSSENLPVFTTIEQRLSGKDGTIFLDRATLGQPFDSKSVEKVKWVVQDSTAYIFPSPTRIFMSNDTAHGSWRAINHQAWATDAIVSKKVFTLWLDHGTTSSSGTYEYIVVPAIGEGQVRGYISKNNVDILSNDSDIQAVMNRSTGVTEAVFYREGQLKAGSFKVTIASPGMLMVRQEKGKITEITVSDPSRKLKAIDIIISDKLSGESEKWSTTYNAERSETKIHFILPGAERAGESVSAFF